MVQRTPDDTPDLPDERGQAGPPADPHLVNPYGNGARGSLLGRLGALRNVALLRVAALVGAVTVGALAAAVSCSGPGAAVPEPPPSPLSVLGDR